jgi:uncharacterized membrane protein
MAGMLLSGCTNNTLDDLEPMQQDDDDGGVEFVVFGDVQPIFNNNCVICHANPPLNGSIMPLVTFNNVREAVNNRDLLDRISRNQGESGLMPLGGPRLPENSIDLISQWEEDGLLEN